MKFTKRKICVVVTARPSYSRVKTVLDAINSNKKLELQLVVMASALIDRYGRAVDFIENDGFKINSKIHSVLEGENIYSAPKTTAIGIMELSTVFFNLKPDIVVTIADRFETMSTAITASYMNIPLAHIQGGEVTGNIDEKVRHAITKLSDYHFVSTGGAKQRVIRLGENPKYVFNTGCPSLDLARNIGDLNFDPYLKYGGVGKYPKYKKGYLVVMQHPVTNEYKESRSQISHTLKAIRNLNIPTFWFWPNIDAGSDGTSGGIRSFRETNNIDNIHFFKNMEPRDFLILIKNSICLIGNSSVAIRECSFLGVPVVNIGSRQNRRERADNVIDVNYNHIEIEKAIVNSKVKKPKSSKIYGNGKAGAIIADLLFQVKLISHKTIEY